MIITLQENNFEEPKKVNARNIKVYQNDNQYNETLTSIRSI